MYMDTHTHTHISPHGYRGMQVKWREEEGRTHKRDYNGSIMSGFPQQSANVCVRKISSVYTCWYFYTGMQLYCVELRVHVGQ